MYDCLMVEQGSLGEEDTTLEAQRRSQLMKATMECVAEFGVEKTTMWMVAERAGVSTGMLLYYYHTKRELITSAVKLASKDFAQRLFSLTHGTWGTDRLQESVKVFLGESVLVPKNFLIQYRMAALNDPDIRQSSLEQYQNSRSALSRSVSAAQAQGEIRSDVDDVLVADLIYTLANGLAAEVAAHPEIMSPERASLVAQMALNAFSSEAKAPGAAKGHNESTETPSASQPPAIGEVASSTIDAIEALLLGDAGLRRRTAEDLANAFRSLYEISLREKNSDS